MDQRFDLNGASFVWDVAKARRNRDKHGIAFEQAAEVFFDPFLRLVDAGRNDETRDAAIGRDTRGRVLYVVHVIYEDEAIRLISARKATTAEQQTYDS